MLSVHEFARRLEDIPEKEFHRSRILDFMRGNKVDSASLEPHLYFSAENYTRNLIQRTPIFELIAICWDIGQKSPIHNHCEQECWMAAPIGKVQVHNFKLIQRDRATKSCELESSNHFIIDPDTPNEVDPSEPIHVVANPAAFGARAVTLHVYSKPYDTCEVYDLKTKRYEVVPLVNTTEYGVVKQTGLRLERMTLAPQH
jgi:predicted metal-dependent enzyme (double-stranded beta helix superfamily)